MTDQPSDVGSAPQLTSANPALRPIEDAYPLTRLQQGLLLRCLSYPDRPLYLGQWWALLKGSFDVEAFVAAWQAVIDRHTALRSGFQWEIKDRPFQVVHRQASLKPCVLDWSEPGQQDAWRSRLQAWLEQDRAQGFDLKRPPLLRLTLIRLTENQHLVVWTRHHLVVDGWSLGIILDEVFAHYKAAREGIALQLPPATPFRRYVTWEQSHDAGAAIAHWRALLSGRDTSGEVEGQQIATWGESDAPRIREIERRLTASSTQALKTLARASQVTLNTLFQAAWALVGARFAGAGELLFGAVESARLPEASGPLVGVQIQILPVMARVGELALGDWLRELQAAAVASREVGAIPTDDLRELLGLPRDRLPFDSLVGFQNYPLDADAALSGSGLALLESADLTLPDMPLNLMVEQEPDFVLRLMFDEARYDNEEAVLRLDMLVAALARLPEAVDQPASDLDPLPAALRASLLDEDVAPLAVPADTVVDLILRQATRQGAAPAISHEGRRVSYAGLLQGAVTIAGRLADAGVVPGQRVGLHLRRTPRAIAAILGTLLRGAAYVPLDPDLPESRKAGMIADATIGCVLSEGIPPLPGVATVTIDDVMLDGGHPPDSSQLSLPSAANEAYVIFTSGTTGRPKGVSIGHDNLRYHVAARQASPGHQRIEALLLSFPLAFDGSVTGIFSTLADGGCLVLPPATGPADAEELLRLIAAERVSHTIMIPSQWSLLLASERVADLRCLKVAVVAGEACTRALVERHYEVLPDTQLCNEYGPTESTVWATVERCAPGEGGPVSLGRPIPGMRAYVVDSLLRPCPPHCAGELLLAGPGIARGYVGHAQLSAERFIRNPFHDVPGFAVAYRTGDRVKKGVDGRLWFLGRADDQVKVSGYRIELAEISAALEEHPAVAESALVVHRPGADAPARLYAHVAGAALPGSTELLDFLRARLPHYMLPHAIVPHPRLPRTATGKVDRHVLPLPRLERSSEAPRGRVEEAIGAAWQAILGISTVGRDDDFFAIGGGSLAAMQVASRLRRELRQPVELLDLFEYPRLADLARRLEGRESTVAPVMRRRRRVRVDLEAEIAPGEERS